MRKERAGNYVDSLSARSISSAVTQGIREELSTNDEMYSITQLNQTPLGYVSNNQSIGPRDSNSVSFNVENNATSTDQLRSRRQSS